MRIYATDSDEEAPNIQVRSTFVGKHKGRYMFDPYTAALRYKTHFPDAELTDEGLMVNMAQKVIFNTVYGSMIESEYSEQQIVAATSEITHDFQMGDVYIVEQALRTTDNAALYDFIASLSTQRRIL